MEIVANESTGGPVHPAVHFLDLITIKPHKHLTLSAVHLTLLQTHTHTRP